MRIKLLFFILPVWLCAQDSIKKETLYFVAKVVPGIDMYDLAYDDMFYSGANLQMELAFSKHITVQGFLGYHGASAYSKVSTMGLGIRWYFKKEYRKWYVELNISRDNFKFSPRNPIDTTFNYFNDLPSNVISIFINAGYQKVYRDKFVYGAKLGGGMFNPYFPEGQPPTNIPPIRFQFSLEFGYKF